MPDFPALDDLRQTSNAEHGRVILDHLGYVNPFIDATDNFCSLPLRLTYTQTAGWHLELGPYDLDHADIETLRAAIFAYDDATQLREC